MSEQEAVHLLRLRIQHDGRARQQYDRLRDAARLLVAGLADGATDAEAISLVGTAAAGLKEAQ